MTRPTRQTTLLTSHKGVDLHAATALLVMKDRLEGGERLDNLLRCELHTYWGEPAGMSMVRLLDVGRYFNPNKHHYGHFQSEPMEGHWLGDGPAGTDLDVSWPGSPKGTDLELPESEMGHLYHRLLGGPPPEGTTAVDVVSFARGQEGPVLSGVLWRLLITGDAASALAVGANLAVASHRKEGLLVNPHMEAWLAGTR